MSEDDHATLTEFGWHGALGKLGLQLCGARGKFKISDDQFFGELQPARDDGALLSAIMVSPSKPLVLAADKVNVCELAAGFAGAPPDQVAAGVVLVASSGLALLTAKRPAFASAVAATGRRLSSRQRSWQSRRRSPRIRQHIHFVTHSRSRSISCKTPSFHVHVMSRPTTFHLAA